MLWLQGRWKQQISQTLDLIKMYCSYYSYYCELELKLFLSGGIELHTVDFNIVKLKKEIRIAT